MTSKPQPSKYKPKTDKRRNEGNLIRDCRYCGGTHAKYRNDCHASATERITLQNYVNKSKVEFIKSGKMN